MLTSRMPQWIEQSFIRSALATGASASREAITDCYLELLEFWRKPDRHHHDIRHLTDMLKRVDTMAPETPHADRVRLAAWFHGIVFSTSDLAVYTRNGGEDELASAKLALVYMENLGIDEKIRKAIASLITGLKKSDTINSDPNMCGPRPDETSTIEMIDMDQLALHDAHMGSLAVEPQKYKHYLEEIQKEYAHIPRAHFLFARKEIVSKLLARKKLFLSPLAAQWEAPARENLEAELERLNSKLHELDNIPVAKKKQDMNDSHQADLAEESHTANEDTSDTAEESADYSHDIEETYPASSANNTAVSAPSLSNVELPTSSLEKLKDIYSPGRAPRTNLSTDEALREQRKKIAAEAWQEIEQNMN